MNHYFTCKELLPALLALVFTLGMLVFFFVGLNIDLSNENKKLQRYNEKLQDKLRIMQMKKYGFKVKIKV